MRAQVVAALLAAAERKKVAYHTAALAALEVALRAFGDADHFAAVSPPLLEACRRSRSPSKSPTHKHAISLFQLDDCHIYTTHRYTRWLCVARIRRFAAKRTSQMAMGHPVDGVSRS